MLQTQARILLELVLCLATAVATHYFMSFAQTFMHHTLGHQAIGGRFRRNHLSFHHTFYYKNHLVSPTYRGDEGNNTPFFFIPVCLAGACTFFRVAVVSLHRAGDRLRSVILHARPFG
jgi:hypothetical protein